MVHARQSTIPAGCDWLSIWPRTGSFTMSRTAHQSALIFAAIATTAATTRQETASTEPRSASAIDRSVKTGLTTSKSCGVFTPGQEVDHFGRNDQEQIHQDQDRKYLIRLDALRQRRSSRPRQRARSEINQRIGSQGDRVLSGLPIVQDAGQSKLREQDRHKKGQQHQRHEGVEQPAPHPAERVPTAPSVRASGAGRG